MYNSRDREADCLASKSRKWTLFVLQIQQVVRVKCHYSPQKTHKSTPITVPRMSLFETPSLSNLNIIERILLLKETKAKGIILTTGSSSSSIVSRHHNSLSPGLPSSRDVDKNVKDSASLRLNFPRGGGGGGLRYEMDGVLVVSLRGVNFGFWSRLGCSGQNVIIFSR